MSLIAAFTVGSMGHEGRPFIEDLRQAGIQQMLMCLLAGAIWNLGTLCLVAAISLAGMAIAFTFGGGLAWVLGIWVQYANRPEGNALFLAIGSVTITIAVLLSMWSFKRVSASQNKKTGLGVFLAVMVGIMISVYYLFMQRAIEMNFDAPTPGLLSNYTAVVFFSAGAFLSTFIYNLYFMRKPVQGDPVSFRDYRSGPISVHFWGVLGGMIWCCGNVFTFMAVKAAGPAISYGLSIAAPLVAAIWGVFVWREFKGAPKGTGLILAAMFLFYLLSLGIIILAKTAS